MASAAAMASNSRPRPPIFTQINPFVNLANRDFWQRYWRTLTHVNGKKVDKPSLKTNPEEDVKELEYLFEDLYPSYAGPSWSTRICYGTGLTYMCGLGVGGGWGLSTAFTPSISAPFIQQGLIQSSSSSLSAIPWRLRWNAILNAMTSRGPFAANTAASLALLYNICHGAQIKWLRDGEYGMESAVTSATAAGALFRSTKGLRAMAKAGGLAGLGMLVYCMVEAALNIPSSTASP